MPRRAEVATVPWHPMLEGEDELPGWLIRLIPRACWIIGEQGGLVSFAALADFARALSEYWPQPLDLDTARGFVLLLEDFGFIARVGNALGGSA